MFKADVRVLISKVNMRIAIITRLKSTPTEMEREKYYSEDAQTGEQII